MQGLRPPSHEIITQNLVFWGASECQPNEIDCFGDLRSTKLTAVDCIRRSPFSLPKDRFNTKVSSLKFNQNAVFLYSSSKRLNTATSNMHISVVTQFFLLTAATTCALPAAVTKPYWTIKDTHRKCSGETCTWTITVDSTQVKSSSPATCQ